MVLMYTLKSIFNQHSQTVSDAYDNFVRSFLKLCKECIPSSCVTVRPNDRPWYNTEIRRTSRQN